MVPYLGCDFTSRLGNVILEIFATFIFAEKHNIPYEKIKIRSKYNSNIGWIDPITRKNNPIDDYIQRCHRILRTPFLQKFYVDENEWNNLFGKLPKMFWQDASERCKKSLNTVISVMHWVDTEEHRKLFHKIFNIEEKYLSELRDIYEYYFSYSPNVAVHVRRTDYAKIKNGIYIKTKEEILKQLKENKNFSNTRYVMFSDDIEWCIQNFREYDNFLFHPTVNKYPDHDMLVMSLFDDIVSGTNSTYSYIAKILNKNIPLSKNPWKQMTL